MQMFLCLMVLTSLARLYISNRQLYKYKQKMLDMYISEFFQQDEFEASQSYNEEKLKFSMFKAIFTLTLEFCLWYFFVFIWIWNQVDSVMGKLNICQSVTYKNDMLQAYLFIVATTIMQMVIDIPFTIYSTFVIEEKWGYNKTTAGTFVCDQLKQLVLACLLMGIFVPLMLWIIHVAGPALIPSLIGFSVVMILFINLLVPTVILPLFFTLTDLEDGELKTAIFAES